MNAKIKEQLNELLQESIPDWQVRLLLFHFIGGLTMIDLTEQHISDALKSAIKFSEENSI